jgi:hypothetical protein
MSLMTPAEEVVDYRQGYRRAAVLTDAAVRLLTDEEREREGLVIESNGRILLFASPDEARRRQLLAAAGPDPDWRRDDVEMPL